jgi:branched-chain amino acid aminotransferase
VNRVEWGSPVGRHPGANSRAPARRSAEGRRKADPPAVGCRAGEGFDRRTVVERLVYVDGRVLPEAEAAVPVLDRGFIYGDGCFDALAFVNGYLFRYEDHRTRFLNSARLLAIEREGLQDELDRAIPELLSATKVRDAYIKVVLTRGAGDMPRIDADCTEGGRLVIFVLPRSHDGDPAEVQPGVSLATVSVRRPPPEVLDPRIKSLNYLNIILARQQAKRAAADEALLLDLHGEVAEASIFNIFAVVNGALLTPSSPSTLRGITQRVVFEIAADLGIECARERLTSSDLVAADEVFLTGTGGGIVPVRTLDACAIGSEASGSLTRLVARSYRERQLEGHRSPHVRDL